MQLHEGGVDGREPARPLWLGQEQYGGHRLREDPGYKRQRRPDDQVVERGGQPWMPDRPMPTNQPEGDRPPRLP